MSINTLCRIVWNDKHVIGQCCYGKNDTLVISRNGGLDVKADPVVNYFEHFSKDLWPIIVCCGKLDAPSDGTCSMILNDDSNLYYRKSSAKGYSAFPIGKHTITMLPV